MSEPRKSLDAPPDERGEDRQERMQRIRVGLTGLAIVLILVFVATFAISRLQTPVANNSAVAESSNEPFADLGVAPGAADENATAASPAKK